MFEADDLLVCVHPFICVLNDGNQEVEHYNKHEECLHGPYQPYQVNIDRVED